MIELFYPSNLGNVSFDRLTFHNLTTFKLSQKMTRYLGLGLKFIPLNKPPSALSLKEAIEDFARSVRIREKFMNDRNKIPLLQHLINPDANKDNEFQARFYIRKPEFTPPKASAETETYLKTVITDITSKVPWQLLTSFKPHPLFNELRALKENPDIVIRPSDKNLGPVLMWSTDYERMCMKHLNDRTTYQVVNQSKEAIIKQVQKAYTKNQSALTEDLLQVGYFLSPEDIPGPTNLVTGIKSFRQRLQFKQYLTESIPEPTIPKFHCMPKLHKDGELSGRPIVGAVNWVSTPLSAYIDFQLRPLITSIPTILKDSYQLVNELRNLYIPTGSYLVTMDVVALYPNMINADIIRMIDNLPHLNLRSRTAIRNATKFILQNAYCTFNDKIYEQVNGMPMGTNAAVSLANLYMHHYVESKQGVQTWIESHALIFRRFIDDLFFIWTGNEEDLQTFHQLLRLSHPKIDLTMKYSQSTIDFLDLQISINSNQVTTSVFQKALNKYLYIPPTSNHPPSVFKGMIRGEFTRYARLCSDSIQFTDIWTKFKYRLGARGYSTNFINQCVQGMDYRRINWIQSLERPPPQATDTNVVFFKIMYHPTLKQAQIGSIINRHLHLANPDLKLKPIVCWKADANLGRLLTSSDFSTKPTAKPTVSSSNRKRNSNQSTSQLHKKQKTRFL